MRLLEAALEEPELKLLRAVALVDYHIRRSQVAKTSHDKTWKEKHAVELVACMAFMTNHSISC